MTEQVSIDELRSNLADIIGRVIYSKDMVIVKKNNQNVAVILNFDEYEKLVGASKRVTKKQREAKFKVFENIQKRIPESEQEELEKDIARAVKEVRAEKRNKNK